MTYDEPRISIQARICPWCIDDHSENRECNVQHLIETIARLEEKLRIARQCLEHYAEMHLSMSYEVEDKHYHFDGTKAREALEKTK